MRCLCLGASAVLAVGAAVAGWFWLTGLGIDPTRHSYGAAVWTLLGTMGLHLVIGAGMALWCLAAPRARHDQFLALPDAAGLPAVVALHRAGDGARPPDGHGVPPCRLLSLMTRSNRTPGRGRSAGCSTRPSGTSSGRRTSWPSTSERRSPACWGLARRAREPRRPSWPCSWR